MSQRMIVEKGDITAYATEAIVNAANNQLGPGSGVNGAIRRAAGPGLAAECREIGGCPTGEARITRGHDLAAGHVIHTVGPVWQGGGHNEDDLLAACYRNSLALAAESGLRSIAFPAISTGVFGFPPERAAPIAARTVRAFLDSEAGAEIEKVIFVCFDDAQKSLMDKAVAEAGQG